MRKSIVPLLIALLAIGSFVSCGQRAPLPPPSEEPVMLRTYVVPEPLKRDVRSMLAYAVGGVGGRVAQGPAGTIVVVAPPAVQAGVASLLRDLERVEAVPVGPKPVTLTYWFLLGRPLEGEGGPVRIVGAGGIPAIDAALGRIAESEGPTEFKLLERVRLSSLPFDPAEMSGRYVRISQHTTPAADGIVAGLEIEVHGGNRLESEVMLEKGQVLVLGQAGWAGKPGLAFERGNLQDLTLYYVITADS